LRGIDPLGAAYRAVNIGQVFLLLGHYSDAYDLLEDGKQRLLSLGEIRNASVAGHQQVESLVKRMRVSRTAAQFEQAFATLQISLQWAGQVSNDDYYWRNMLFNLRWMEDNLKGGKSESSKLEPDVEAPFALGMLFPRRWPFFTLAMKTLAGLRGGKICLVPQPNAQEMVDLRSDMEFILHGHRDFLAAS
jgi:hypothetical protein